MGRHIGPAPGSDFGGVSFLGCLGIAFFLFMCFLGLLVLSVNNFIDNLLRIMDVAANWTSSHWLWLAAGFVAVIGALIFFSIRKYEAERSRQSR